MKAVLLPMETCHVKPRHLRHSRGKLEIDFLQGHGKRSASTFDPQVAGYLRRKRYVVLEQSLPVASQVGDYRGRMGRPGGKIVAAFDEHLANEAFGRLAPLQHETLSGEETLDSPRIDQIGGNRGSCRARRERDRGAIVPALDRDPEGRQLLRCRFDEGKEPKGQDAPIDRLVVRHPELVWNERSRRVEDAKVP